MLKVNQMNMIKREISTMFFLAKLSKYSSKKINEEYFKIRDKFPKKITTYEIFYLKGIFETYKSFFESENIIFCHVLKSGEIIEAKKHNRYDEIVSDGLYFKDCSTVYFNGGVQ